MDLESVVKRNIWRHHRGYQKLSIKEKQTPQRHNNNLQNTTQKTKEQATQTSLNTGGELRCSRGKQFLFHYWNSSYYSCYKPGDKSWMRKGPDCDYDKQNISMSFVTQILHNGQHESGNHGNREIFIIGSLVILTVRNNHSYSSVYRL